MLDQKFSYKSFKNLGLDSDKARKLADELEFAVTKEFHLTLKDKMVEIVENLNAMGHNLRLYEDFNSDEVEDAIGYRDDNGIDSSSDDYACKLRLDLTLIIAAGFSHFTDCKE